MPSPIAHLAVGYGIYRIAYRGTDTTEQHKNGQTRLLVVCLGLSLAPDLDSFVGLIVGDFGRFHNNFTHSPLFGLGFACLFAYVAAKVSKTRFKTWFGLATFCIMAHIFMDYLTWGRGIMLLWPMSADRFRPPWPIFYGLHWSNGLASIHHIWTIVSELGFAAIFLGAVAVLKRKRIRKAKAW